jgi:hypothetical protein
MTSKCQCGAVAIETAQTWAINRNRTGSVGPARDEAVCYGMGPDRMDARDYAEHVLRLAQSEGRDEATLAIVGRKVSAAKLATSPRA